MQKNRMVQFFLKHSVIRIESKCVDNVFSLHYIRSVI